MKLVRIKIKNLYGSFSLEMELNSKLNLLVGINGSGKTSVLNCIDWMLRPNFAKLASVQFDLIELSFLYQEKVYLIKAIQTKEQLVISEEGGNGFPWPITVNFIRAPEAIRTEAERNQLIRHYSNLGPESTEKKLWSFLEELPHPLTVTLDRTISAETDQEYYVDSDSPPWAREAQLPVASPLDKVREVTQARFANYRKEIYFLNEKLKTELVVSAFREPFQKPRSIKKISFSDIVKLESKVTSLLGASLGLEEGVSQVARYFDSAKRFAKSAASDEKMQVLFWSQYQQIGDLALAFNDYELSASVAYQPLGSYLAAINSFFFDSGKRIAFDDKDGGLAFQFVNERGDPKGPFRPLERLSSGERQILILITFLAFVLPADHVFVVDEPELSLHPKWQSNFLDAILDQAPVDTQVLVATHSPEIAGRHRQYCKVLGAL